MKSISITLIIVCLFAFVSSTEAQFFKRKDLGATLLSGSQKNVSNSFWHPESLQQAGDQPSKGYSRLSCPVSITQWIDNSSSVADSLIASYSLQHALPKHPVASRVVLTPTVTLLLIN